VLGRIETTGVDTVIENCSIIYTTGTDISGINIGTGGHHTTVKGCLISGLFSIGIYILANVARCVITGNEITGMGGSGVYITGIQHNGAGSGSYNIMTGNCIHTLDSTSYSARGIYFVGGYYNIISGNTIYDIDSGSNPGYGINANSARCCIIGNTIYNITGTGAKSIASSGDYCSVTGNNCPDGKTVSGTSSVDLANVVT
jgi:hypothetical protein